MNPTIARRFLPTAGAGLAAVAMAAALAGCGQTGPLYMPTPPAKPSPAAVIEANPRPAPPVPSINASVPAPTR